MQDKWSKTIATSEGACAKDHKLPLYRSLRGEGLNSCQRAMEEQSKQLRGSLQAMMLDEDARHGH